MRKKILLAIAFSLGIWAYLLLLAASPKQAPQGAAQHSDLDEGITVLFSPSGGCTEAIIAEIAKATATVDIQAYSFTSPAIAQAVVDAFDRGVRIRIVMDKSQKTDHYSSATFLQNHHVPVSIDDQHGIAHNKIVLIDNKVVITGSFNFTKSSEDRNAENLLILRDRPKLVASYQANFERHLAHSIALTPAR